MKTLVTIMALCLATAFSANAQTTKKAEKSATQSTKVAPQQDLSKQVQAQTDRMTKDLGLSEDQAQQVLSQNKTLYSDMHSMNSDNVKTTDRENMTSRTLDNYDSNLQDILDETQYRKYQTMKADYMKGFNTPKVADKQTKDGMGYE